MNSLKTDKITFRELGPLAELINKLGLEITHAYDDIVFVSHTAFLFQFLEDQTLAVRFNQDCSAVELMNIEKNIMSLAKSLGLTIIVKGRFSLRQKEEEENLELQFFDDL